MSLLPRATLHSDSEQLTQQLMQICRVLSSQTVQQDWDRKVWRCLAKLLRAQATLGECHRRWQQL
jgi:hypothetical protein